MGAQTLRAASPSSFVPASSAGSPGSGSAGASPAPDFEQRQPTLRGATNSGSVSQSNTSATISNSGVSAPRVVTTPAAASVDTVTATLNGIVNPSGLAASYWFDYGTKETLAQFSSTAQQNLLASSAETSVSALLVGLTPHTTYYFRVKASSGAGTSAGQILQFRSGGAGQRSTLPWLSPETAAVQLLRLPWAILAGRVARIPGRNASQPHRHAECGL